MRGQKGGQSAATVSQYISSTSSDGRTYGDSACAARRSAARNSTCFTKQCCEPLQHRQQARRGRLAQQTRHQRHGQRGKRGVAQRGSGDGRGEEGEEVDGQQSEQPRGGHLLPRHEMREERVAVARLLREEEAPELRGLRLRERGGVKEPCGGRQGYHS